MINRFFQIAIVLALLLALLSCIAFIMGLPVNNLLSAEGFRWLLVHGVQDGAFRYLPAAVLAAIALGTVPLRRTRHSTFQLFLRYALLLGFWIFMGLWKNSPLRGISGGLWPSPLSHSWFAILCLSLTAVNLSFAWNRVGQALADGIRRYALALSAFLVLAFLYNELNYILWT
ncbi:MAG: hypothetical protein K2F69_07625 [Bacteroidaceae bacterium]|nr:hypothetical protein [Bacteroidaceae bacterium]